MLVLVVSPHHFGSEFDEKNVRVFSFRAEITHVFEPDDFIPGIYYSLRQISVLNVNELPANNTVYTEWRIISPVPYFLSCYVVLTSETRRSADKTVLV